MAHDPPLQLILGPSGHGVVDYAVDVGSAAIVRRPGAPVTRAATPDEALERIGAAARVHLHVTDRLLGATPEHAADALERIARGRALSITLHDVPQCSDGRNLARRVTAYRRFVDAAARVIVNSAHERALVGEHLDREVHAVIPLGARTATAPSWPDRRAGSDLVVLIAGYVYPGKGHAPAIDATARAGEALREAGRDVGRIVVRAIGRPSPGHEGDVAALTARAEAQGVAFEITGFLGAEEFAHRITDPGIPLAAHEHVSASRSILDWIEAGRRPLVVRSRYADETAALRPDTLSIYDPVSLADALAASWSDPAITRLPPGTPLGPTVADVAAQYLAQWAA